MNLYQGVGMPNSIPSEPNLPSKNPGDPGQGQQAQPSTPEINPAKPGNDTEVDLDRTKTNTYPDKTPPERH
jgi:hypothetical protein